MLDRNSVVMVFNYRKCKVVLPASMGDDYIFYPAEDKDTPYGIPMRISDIQSINTQSQVFRSKRLAIDPEDEEEVVKLINIKYDDKNIFTIDEKKDIIINPTTEKLEKIIKVDDKCILDDFKNIYLDIKYSGEYVLSERVEQVVDARYHELVNNKNVLKSKILLVAKKNEAKIKNKIDKEVEIESDEEKEVKPEKTKSKKK